MTRARMKVKTLKKFGYMLKKKLKRQSTMPSWHLSLGVGKGTSLLNQALSPVLQTPLTRRSQNPLIALIQGMMKVRKRRKKRRRWSI